MTFNKKLADCYEAEKLISGIKSDGVQGSSGTVVSVRQYLETMIHDHESRNEDRFRERDLRYEQRFKGIEEATHQKSISLDKRLDTMNEFRFTLSDQQKNFMTRSETLALIVAVSTLVGCIVGVLEFLLKARVAP